MAASETARLIASLELKDKLSQGVRNAQTNLGKFESRWDKLGNKLKTGLAIGAGGIGTLVQQRVYVLPSPAPSLDAWETQAETQQAKLVNGPARRVEHP